MAFPPYFTTMVWPRSDSAASAILSAVSAADDDDSDDAEAEFWSAVFVFTIPAVVDVVDGVRRSGSAVKARVVVVTEERNTAAEKEVESFMVSSVCLFYK